MNTDICPQCHGDGWFYEYDGCGDPECCGDLRKVKCWACDNDWDPDAE